MSHAERRPMSKEAVLITGASSGIGEALARRFAAQGFSLVLVAANEAELKTVALRLSSEFHVPVQAIAQDLREEGAPEEIFLQITESGQKIEILVNNAGIGHRGKFWEIPFGKQISILRVNIEAVIRMTRIFLPPMLERGSGKILNTASVAGFEPGPSLAVYHASKAFVLSFSEALATELENTGVTVTALCPGATDTAFFAKADMLSTRVYQEVKLMPPEEVAEAGYKSLMAGERLVVTGAANKALVFKRRLTTEEFQAKANETLYEEKAS